MPRDRGQALVAAQPHVHGPSIDMNRRNPQLGWNLLTFVAMRPGALLSTPNDARGSVYRGEGWDRCVRLCPARNGSPQKPHTDGQVCKLAVAAPDPVLGTIATAPLRRTCMLLSMMSGCENDTIWQNASALSGLGVHACLATAACTHSPCGIRQAGHLSRPSGDRGSVHAFHQHVSQLCIIKSRTIEQRRYGVAYITVRRHLTTSLMSHPHMPNAKALVHAVAVRKMMLQPLAAT